MAKLLQSKGHRASQTVLLAPRSRELGRLPNICLSGEQPLSPSSCSQFSTWFSCFFLPRFYPRIFHWGPALAAKWSCAQVAHSLHKGIWQSWPQPPRQLPFEPGVPVLETYLEDAPMPSRPCILAVLWDGTGCDCQVLETSWMLTLRIGWVNSGAPAGQRGQRL